MGELYRRLEQPGHDAGVDIGFRDWAVQALQINGELDRLLATLDEWRDAAAEIWLEMPKDDAIEHLLLTCRARIARSDGDERAQLERLRRLLQDAARRIRRISDPEERLAESAAEFNAELAAGSEEEPSPMELVRLECAAIGNGIPEAWTRRGRSLRGRGRETGGEVPPESASHRDSADLRHAGVRGGLVVQKVAQASSSNKARNWCGVTIATSRKGLSIRISWSPVIK